MPRFPLPPRTLRIVVFAIVALASIYFAQGGGMNPNSRYDLTRAIVEDGTFRIDRFAHNTFDRAERDGHFYSDKAPGLSFAAVPVYAVSRHVLTPAPPERSPGTAELHAVTAVVVGLSAAAASLLLLDFLASLGLGLVASSVAIIAGFLGTNAFAYSTLFLAHELVAALLVISFALVHRGQMLGGRGQLWHLAAAGFVASWAAISEYPVAPLAVLVFAYAISTVGIQQAWRVWPFATAALPPLLLLAFFNLRCFGSPFALGYSNLASEEFRGVISQGVYGFSWPRPAIFWEVLFGEFRGLLPLSPFLVLVVPGVVRLYRGRSLRWLALGCLGACAYGVLLVTSYARWDGGAGMGPRYFVPMLPFTIPLVAAGLEWTWLDLAEGSIGRDVGRLVAGMLIVISISICTMSVAVMPEFLDTPAPRAPIPELAPLDMRAPVRNFVIPMFVRGRLSEKGVGRTGQIGFSSINTGHENDAFNLGEKLGLSGFWSLVPLFAAWSGLLVLGARSLKLLGKDGNDDNNDGNDEVKVA